MIYIYIYLHIYRLSFLKVGYSWHDQQNGMTGLLLSLSVMISFHMESNRNLFQRSPYSKTIPADVRQQNTQHSYEVALQTAMPSRY